MIKSFTVRPKVNSLYTVRQRGGRFLERQEWLLAAELLCHCCRAKLLGITVLTAAVARDVHSNRTYKRKTKSMLWLCKCHFCSCHQISLTELLPPVCCCPRQRCPTDILIEPGACCSYCYGKLPLMMWWGILSFLLLSNLKDFLLWWSNQVAPAWRGVSAVRVASWLFSAFRCHPPLLPPITHTPGECAVR